MSTIKTANIQNPSAGSAAITIDTSSRVGIGTASPQAQLDVRGANLADDTYGNVNIFTTEAATTNYGGSIALGGGTTGGTTPYVCGKIKGARDGASTYSGYLSFLTMSTGSVVTERMRLDNSGRLLVGTSSATANGGVLQVSNGITFPATQSACSDVNTLDDYEEGTWTPTIRFGGATTGITGSFTGRYVKIGKYVYYHAAIVFTSKGSATGSTTITGLPFACASTSYDPGATWSYNMVSLTGSIITRTGDASTTLDVFQDSSAGSNNSVLNSNFNNDSQLRITGMYTV